MLPIDMIARDIVKFNLEYINFIQYITECEYVTCSDAIEPVYDDI